MMSAMTFEDYRQMSDYIKAHGPLPTDQEVRVAGVGAVVVMRGGGVVWRACRMRKGGRTWWWGPRFSGVCPAASYSPTPCRCSTIGAGGLSFRVRNGSGRFPSAMAAVTL